MLCCLLFFTLAQGAEMDPKTLLPGWDLLEVNQKKVLSAQIEKLDLKELERQRALIGQETNTSKEVSTFGNYQLSGDLGDQETGKKLIAEGKVGCLIVAGGQGSRLKFTKPKGFYPVTLIKAKPLFQLFAEKILAAGKRAGRPLYVAIMTSTENHEETVLSFKEHDYFGLSRGQIFFFSQKDLPLLNPEGDLFLESPGHLAMGPDGNASSLREFVASGIWNLWNKEGISYLNYLHIDNPLADPFDAELTGFHSRFLESDMIVKCIQRENSEEKIGVMFQIDGKAGVIEYSELSKEERSLKNACANIGLYSFSMDFIHAVATRHYNELPFHKAWKAATYLTPDGISKKSEKPIAWKFEKFIFDVMPFAQNVKALLYSRKDCFAPLKNAEGDDSLTSVQEALQAKDRDVFERITGTPADSMTFELDPAFYYPTKELLEKWKGRALPATLYIDP